LGCGCLNLRRRRLERGLLEEVLHVAGNTFIQGFQISAIALNCHSFIFWLARIVKAQLKS
jgi:hypothetical protein